MSTDVLECSVLRQDDCDSSMEYYQINLVIVPKLVGDLNESVFSVGCGFLVDFPRPQLKENPCTTSSE